MELGYWPKLFNQMQITFLTWKCNLHRKFLYGIHWRITIMRFHRGDNLFRNRPVTGYIWKHPSRKKQAEFLSVLDDYLRRKTNRSINFFWWNCLAKNLVIKLARCIRKIKKVLQFNHFLWNVLFFHSKLQHD